LNSPIIEVKEVAKWFPVRRGFFAKVNSYVKAVNGVSFTMQSGETLGLVGESGCGKSTLAKIILQLLKPTRGKIIFQGAELNKLQPSAMKAVRKDLQIIFQDPYSFLNPRMTVGDILREALLVHHIVPRKEADDRVALLLQTVGLNFFHAKRYPHEFSSGQRQRIGIARALSLNPAFIVCDEPVSALDVSIQAQILNLLMDLKAKYQLTYLFISHDLGIVRHISDTIAVMYLGKIVEIGASESVSDDSLHPYTQVLMESAPIPDPNQIHSRTMLHGDVPSPAWIPSGCPFHSRCPKAFKECETIVPVLAESHPNHFVSCLIHDESWPNAHSLASYNQQKESMKEIR
jgi:peptide/nickel transport system ATP-binding protein